MIPLEPEKSCPLDDVRVLDLTRLIAGNMLTMVLADFGADVVKIEPPERGDPLRDWRVEGVPTHWKMLGRNKRSVALNLRSDDARALLLRLLPSAGVLVENFRPGTLESMGLGPDVLLAENPNLVVIRISGFGQDGPYRARPGFGSLVEAMTGFAAMCGFADREPVLPPLPLADCTAGLFGAFAAMVALRSAEAGGGGQVVDLSLFEPLLSILGPQAAEYKLTGKVKARTGSRSANTSPRNVYRTADGKWLAISASIQSMAKRLLEGIGRGELIEDKRFRTNTDRVAHAEELDAIVGAWIGARTLEDNLGRFADMEVTAAPVYDASQVLDDEHVKARDIIVEVPDADMGAFPMPGVAPRLSRTPGAIRRAAPLLGEHTAEILGAIGLGGQDLSRLQAAGVIDTPVTPATTESAP
ncbi:MAG: CoA transferase [Rhodospirillales bacterium]|nr:CoA transferase [Rhodospirillales bacterium]